MRIRWRVRWLVSGACFALAAAAAGIAHFVVVRAVARALAAHGAPPEQVSATLDAASDAVVAAGVAATILALLLGYWLSGVLIRSLRHLRVEVLGQARGHAVPQPPGIGVAEVEPVAGAARLEIDELRRRLDRAGCERDEMAMLVEAVSDGILQLDSEGRIVRMNAAARALLGLPVGVVGEPIHSLVRHPEIRAALKQAIAGDAVGALEITLDERRVLLTARPLGAAGSAGVSAGEAGASATERRPLGGVVAALADLTELRRLEGVRRDFVANASHELKTPLTSIRGYAETLLGDEVPGEMQRQFVETIGKNAERLQRIIDELLDLSRLESGGWRPELRALDPAEQAADAWASVRERAKAKEIELTISGTDEDRVLADPDGLRQIYANLFENALRYTPSGGRIEVRARRLELSDVGARPGGISQPMVVIEVQDTGTGIPRDALTRIFERFYRADPARSRAEGGTGLGLSIVKHLAESMGGDVAAESELGKGTTLRVRLPSAGVPGAVAIPARPVGST